jgi:hypothetical protein
VSLMDKQGRLTLLQQETNCQSEAEGVLLPALLLLANRTWSAGLQGKDWMTHDSLPSCRSL